MIVALAFYVLLKKIARITISTWLRSPFALHKFVLCVWSFVMATAEVIGAALVAALAPLLENFTQKSMNRNMVDTRGIGRPPSFYGSDKSDGQLACH